MSAAALSDLAIVVAAVMGWAVFFAALIVLHHMDMRARRWLTAAGWLATAAAGAWLGAVPGLTGQAPAWPVLMLATSLAVVVWTNLPALLHQATAPRRSVRRVHLARHHRPDESRT